MPRFSARIDIIGVNPFVHVPRAILEFLFRQARRERGPIPVRGTIDGHPYRQTVVKYAGHWRFYVNGPMLKAAGKSVGDVIALTIRFDPSDRSVPIHPQLVAAFRQDPTAKASFARLNPYRRKEIARYLAHLKSEAAVERNVARALAFLTGKGSFVGQEGR